MSNKINNEEKNKKALSDDEIEKISGGGNGSSRSLIEQQKEENPDLVPHRFHAVAYGGVCPTPLTHLLNNRIKVDEKSKISTRLIDDKSGKK